MWDGTVDYVKWMRYLFIKPPSQTKSIKYWKNDKAFYGKMTKWLLFSRILYKSWMRMIIIKHWIAHNAMQHFNFCVYTIFICVQFVDAVLWIGEMGFWHITSLLDYVLQYIWLYGVASHFLWLTSESWRNKMISFICFYSSMPTNIRFNGLRFFFCRVRGKLQLCQGILMAL